MEALWIQMFLVPAIVCGLASWCVSWWVTKNGKGLGIMDDPKKHVHKKVVHNYPTPRGGGIPIFVSLLIGSWLFMPMAVKTFGIVLGAFILAVTGFADDKFEEKISPYARLIMNILAALCVVGAGIGIAFITNPLGGIIRLDSFQFCFEFVGSGHCVWILSAIFAVVWLVWMQNVIGWSSGVDGQLPGFVITAAITMGLLAFRFGADSGQWSVLALSGIVSGAYLGFLPWNWWPQKMMPGYGGKSLAGFLLGVLAIMSTAKVGAMLMVLGIPIIDAVWVIVKRLSEGRSPVWGGREHLHHYLLDLGWSKSKIAVFYWLTAIFFALLAWQLQPPLKLYTMAAIVLFVSGLVLWLRHWSTWQKPHDPGSG